MSWNPYSWVANSASSPDVSHVNKKRKVNEAGDVGNDITIESIMGELKDLKKSTARIEKLLTAVVDSNKKQVDDANDKEQPVVEEEQEENKEEEKAANEDDEDEKSDSEDEDSSDPEDERKVNETWLLKFDLLCKFKDKHGHCNVSSNIPGVDVSLSLKRWVLRQRYENKSEKMIQRNPKVEKLNSIGFDWSPQTKSPAKKPRDTPAKKPRNTPANRNTPSRRTRSKTPAKRR